MVREGELVEKARKKRTSDVLRSIEMDQAALGFFLLSLFRWLFCQPRD